MLEMIDSIKAQAERDLLYAEAKIEVCNSLISQVNEKMSDCAETPAETNCDEQIVVDANFINTANLQGMEV